MSEKYRSQSRMKRQKRNESEMSNESTFQVSTDKKFDFNVVNPNVMKIFKYLNPFQSQKNSAWCAPRSREWAIEANLVILDSETTELVFAAMGDAIPGIIIKDNDRLKIALDKIQFDHLELYFSKFVFSQFRLDKETFDFLKKEGAVTDYSCFLKDDRGYYLINPEKIPHGHSQMIAEQLTMQREVVTAKVRMALQTTAITKEASQNSFGVGPHPNRLISQSQQMKRPQKLQTRPMTAPGFAAHSANVSGFQRQTPVASSDSGARESAMGAAVRNTSQPLMTSANSVALQTPPAIGNPRSSPFLGIGPNEYNNRSSIASSSNPGPNTIYQMSMPPPQQNGRSISTGSYFGNPTAANGHVSSIDIPGSNLGSQDPDVLKWLSIQGRDGTGSHPSFRAMGRPTDQPFLQPDMPGFGHIPLATGTMGVNNNINGHTMIGSQMNFHPQPSVVPKAAPATGWGAPLAMHRAPAGELIQEHEAPVAPATTQNVEEKNDENLGYLDHFNDLLKQEAFAGPSTYDTWNNLDNGANEQQPQ